jgi:hypothetical protein
MALPLIHKRTKVGPSNGRRHVHQLHDIDEDPFGHNGWG